MSIPPSPRLPSVPSELEMTLSVRIWDAQDTAECEARRALESKACAEHAERMAEIARSQQTTVRPPRRKS